MVATSKTDKLGIGLYTPSEAARFAKLRTQTINRWLFGDKKGEPALRPQLGESRQGDRVVTFCDMIQSVAVRQMRTSEKGQRISLDHVRRVVDECESAGITYPLARRHTLYWYSSRLILKIGDDYYGTTTSVDKQQKYLNPIIEPFLTEVEFGQDDLVATWNPLEFQNYRISLSADRRFGMPTVEPVGVLASALVDAVESEGSIDAAAESFDVTCEAVRIALKYDEFLSSAA